MDFATVANTMIYAIFRVASGADPVAACIAPPPKKRRKDHAPELASTGVWTCS